MTIQENVPAQLCGQQNHELNLLRVTIIAHKLLLLNLKRSSHGSGHYVNPITASIEKWLNTR